MSNICHVCNNHELGTSCAIPRAPFYVTSTDSFMSGWGPAKGKDNICLVPCPDRDTAERVLRYVKSRSDQKDARITKMRPYGGCVIVSNLTEWIKTAKRNGF
jgi:hypothetical protein